MNETFVMYVCATRGWRERISQHRDETWITVDTATGLFKETTVGFSAAATIIVFIQCLSLNTFLSRKHLHPWKVWRETEGSRKPCLERDDVEEINRDLESLQQSALFQKRILSCLQDQEKEGEEKRARQEMNGVGTWSLLQRSLLPSTKRQRHTVSLKESKCISSTEGELFCVLSRNLGSASKRTKKLNEKERRKHFSSMKREGNVCFSLFLSRLLSFLRVCPFAEMIQREREKPFLYSETGMNTFWWET